MKYQIIFFFCTISTFSFGQDPSDKYGYFSKIADSFYRAKDYKNAAMTYSKAFESLGWKGTQTHRYSAARSWALAGVPDSAFYQLNNIVTKQDYSNYVHIVTDPDLFTLHEDERWKPLIESIKQNKEKGEAHLNKPLVAQLDSIFIADQNGRIEIESIEKRYGWESTQMKAHLNHLKEVDSINLIQVKNILDNYGWLGSDVIGATGNLTLFVVIQHADLLTQQKYLPMMRDAVKHGKAFGQNLALLEDRVALAEGKRQVYGTQIGRHKDGKDYYLLPLAEPEHVDRRRKEVGLPPIAEYLSQWQIKWDVEQYKKD